MGSSASRDFGKSLKTRVAYAAGCRARLFMNLPHDCSDRELREWIEAREIHVQSARIIRDLVLWSIPGFRVRHVSRPHAARRSSRSVEWQQNPEPHGHLQRAAVRSSTRTERDTNRPAGR